MKIILNSVLISELFLCWFLYFYPQKTDELKWDTTFYFRVFCAWICWISFAVSSIVTEENAEGEITRQIFIG